jgi:hypothetical protein
MNAVILVQPSASAVALANKWKGAPEEVPQAIKRGMDRALTVTAGTIQLTHLTGKGPFPVTEHRLGERTGQLKLRTRSTAAQITSMGNTVIIEGAIGSSVSYAAYNEFGTRKTPERAPFRTGIKENIGYISDTITKEIMTSLQT